MEVLAGDQALLPEVIRLLEASRNADGKNVDSLYNLGRVYFYEGLTFNKWESLDRAEQIFSTILQLDPGHTRALSFHGSILTAQAQGNDIPKFMQGAQEMKAAIAKDPDNINNRIVLPFTARNFPPQALQAMGNYNPLTDLEFVSQAFDGNAPYYAPHADVVMKAFVGEAYLQEGRKDKARAKFEAALAVPKPDDPGAARGRELLNAAITARMKGGSTPIGAGIFSGCHSCHLSKADKLAK
jgi:tetratricopeptide (TPR) repeat protein